MGAVMEQRRAYDDGLAVWPVDVCQRIRAYAARLVMAALGPTPSVIGRAVLVDAISTYIAQAEAYSVDETTVKVGITKLVSEWFATKNAAPLN
jgi:hypothetical protein